MNPQEWRKQGGGHSSKLLEAEKEMKKLELTWQEKQNKVKLKSQTLNQQWEKQRQIQSAGKIFRWLRNWESQDTWEESWTTEDWEKAISETSRHTDG